MAFTPIQLKKPTTFRRNTGYGEAVIVIPAGETVHYERTEDATHVTHTARCTRDGYLWTSVVTVPKEEPVKQLCTPNGEVIAEESNGKWEDMDPTPTQSIPAPIPQVANAIAATGQTAHNAVAVIANRTCYDQGGDNGERRVKRLARIVEMMSGTIYQLNYYIPADLDIPNPSSILRRYGFRLDGSNWVIPQGALESRHVQAILKEWDRLRDENVTGPSKRRVRYWVIAYTKEQLEKMKEGAQEQLADELREVHGSLIARIDAAAEALGKATEELEAKAKEEERNLTRKERDGLENRHNGRVRAAMKDACESFEMCLRGAELFDDTGSLDALFGSVRDAIRTQMEAANAVLRARRVTVVPIPTSIA